MNALVTIIVPVFLVVGFGYLVSWKKWFSDSAVDGLMAFSQNFAVPVLLFASMAHLDLGTEFSPALLFAFYAGAWISFFAGWGGAKYLFNRPPEDCVAIGFTCLFSNSVLLGIPITERAYGTEALAGNWTIIALHAPLIYTFGISFMEFTRAQGSGLSKSGIAVRALMGTLKTPMVIGIIAGFGINLLMMAGLVMPVSFWAAVDMISQAALPSALFGLGGVLYRYRPEGDTSAIVLCCVCSLIIHPAVAFGFGWLLGLDKAALRSVIMTAALAPGVNAYLFANIYGAARRVVASSVLIGTAMSIISIWMWLEILP